MAKKVIMVPTALPGVPYSPAIEAVTTFLSPVRLGMSIARVKNWKELKLRPGRYWII